MKADTYIHTAGIPIGFSFVFDGATFTTAYPGSNGFLSFNSAAASNTTNALSSVTAASRPLLAPLWDDLDGNATGGSNFSYITTGTAGSRVFTAEWLNWEWNWSSTTPVQSFQIKLYEGTNVIQYIYRSDAGAVVSGSASVGLCFAGYGTGAGTYLSLNGLSASPTTSTTTETTTISAKAATDQVYTFTPPSCFAPATVAAATSIGSAGATLNWTASASAPASGYDYLVVSSGAGIGGTVRASGSVGAGVTTATVASGLSPSTTYDYYVRSNCGGLSGYKGPVSFTTTACASDLIPNSLTAPANVASGCYASPATITVQIKNNGTGTLNFATTPATVTVTTTGPNPQTYSSTVNTGTLAAAATQSVTVTSAYAMTAAGAHVFNASVSMTGDCNTANDNLAAVTRTVINTSLASTYFADFEPSGALPTGWTNTSFSSPGSTHGNPNYGIYKNLYSGATSGSFLTQPMTVNASTDSFRVDYRIVNFSDGSATPTTFGNFKIQYSTNCGGAFTDLYTVDNTNHTPSTSFATIKRSLSALVGQTVIFRILGTWAVGDYYEEFDNFVIGPIPPKTLTASSITATQQTGAIVQGGTGAVTRIDIPVSGTTGTVTLTGLTATYTGANASDITNVRLYRTSTTTFSTASLAGTTTLSGGVATFTLSSPLNGGANYYWLAVDVPGTGATFGNSIDFSIAASGLTFSSSGGGTVTGSNAALNPSGNATVGGLPLKYTVTRATGISYTNITGGTDIFSAASTTVDDNTSSNILPAGFAFTMGGTPVTSLYVTNNGTILLNSSSSPGYQNTIGTTAYNGTGIIAPFYEDLYMNIGSGRVRYIVTGTAPNRTLSIEWFNEEIYNYPGPELDFKANIFETTNVVQFEYNVMQGFNGTNPSGNVTVPAGFAFNYSVGFKNFSVSGTPQPGEVFAAAYENSVNAFTNLFSNVFNRGSNALFRMPDCNSSMTFTPTTGSSTPYVAITTPFPAPANDNPGGAISITPLPTAPANYCGGFYSSLGATQTLAGCTGNADDDVWFTFNAISSSTNISVRPSGGYDAVVEVLDAGLNPLATPVCKNVNNLTGTSFAEDFTVATNIGDDYYVRVYHVGGGTTATGTANISGGAVTSVSIGSGGTGYISSYGGFNNLTQYTKVYLLGGDGTGAAASVTGLTSGAVSAVTIDNGGTGYTVAPTVVFQQPGAGVTGDFAMEIYATPDQPANDNVRDAKALTVNTTGTCSPSYSADLVFGAQNETSRTTACTGTADDDVWYKFTATQSYQHTITIVSSNGINGNIEVFNAGVAPGDTNTMASVACANATGSNGTETATFSVTAGNIYYVRVYNAAAGYGSSAGRFSICAYYVTPMGFEFAQSVGTYTPITGGTDLSGNISSWDSDTTHIDVSPAVTFQGHSYNRIYISTNGFLTLGTTNPPTEFTYSGILSSTYGDVVISPLAYDLDESDLSTAGIRYQLVGNEHVVQWSHMMNYFAAGQDFSFQVRMNYVTGQIRFVYDSLDAGDSFSDFTAGVGIRGIGTGYPDHIMTRGVAPSWERSTSGASASTTMPVTPGSGDEFFTTGLTYQFDPTTCVSYIQQPPTVVSADRNANNATARWNKFSNATSGYYIRWRKTTAPLTVSTWATPTAVGTGVADTSFTITGLFPSTSYYFEVAAACSPTTKTNFSPARSFTTKSAPLDALISALVSPTSGCAGGTSAVIITIKNNGTSNIATGQNLPVSISWTGAASGSLSNTYTVPADITPGSTFNFNVGNASLPTAGTYNFVASVNWASDQNSSNDTVTGSVVASPTYTAPYTEGFNGASLNPDWNSVIVQPTSDVLAGNEHDGYNLDKGVSGFAPQEGADFVSYLGGTLSGDMIGDLYSPCFNITNSCTEMRFYHYQQVSSFPSSDEGTRIYMSVDGGAYSLVTLLNGRGGAVANPILALSSTITTDGWQEFKVDLSAQDGHTVKFKFEGFSVFEANDFGIDNFRMMVRPATDLGITAVQSPEPFPTCASATANVTVTIKNFGCDTAYSTPVQVDFTGGLTQTFSGTYTSKIAPGASKNFTLGTVNLSAIGTYNVSATTQTVGDGDVTNDGALSITTVDASNVPPAITATATPANIIVGAATTLTATAPATGPGIFTNTTNFAIADNSTLNSPITVAGVSAAASTVVRVTFNIQHTYDADLDIALVAPDNSVINLVQDNGTLVEDYTNTSFATGGGDITTGTAPYTGVWAPEDPFSNLTGVANGTWKLRVTDDAAGDVGTLLNWSITFNGVPLTNVWTLPSPPAPVAGFSPNFSGLNPGSRTLTTAGTYNFAFTSSFASGCARTIQIPVNVFEGNQWLGVDNTNPTNNWQNAANWAVSPAPPAPGTAITIPAGTPFQPTVDQAVTVGNLKVANGANLTVNGSGSLTINGSITGNTLANIVGIGPVTLGGTSQQTVNGYVNMNNLTVTNTNATGLTFSPNSYLRIRPGGTLTLGPNARITIPSGQPGALTLQSDASGTARLAPVPSSALITGEIALERKLPASTGWYFVTAPFKGATASVKEWDELPARVAPANNANVFEFTETNSAAVVYPTARDTVSKFGWRPPSSLNNQIDPSDKPKGYRVYQTASLISKGGILTVTGNPITQNVVTPFTFTPTAPGGYDGGGWNLIGNPYACEIDWNAVKFDPTNASAPSGNAVNVFNGATKLYGSYTALTSTTGLAVNGASRYISSSQAFFIKASAAGSLTFKESHKNTTNGATYIRTTDPDNTLRFTFSQGANEDEAAIVFLNGASQGLDQFDAKNMASEVVDGASGANLAINVMPALTQREEIPMNFMAAAGQAKIRFNGLSSFPTTARIYLRDSYLGTLTEIIDGSEYAFNVTGDPASSNNARFTLVFEPTRTGVEKAIVTPILSAWPNPVSSVKEELNVQLNNFGTGKAQVVLVDVLGKAVFVANPDLSTTNALTISLKGMPAGVYTLKASSGDIAQQKQIVVE